MTRPESPRFGRRTLLGLAGLGAAALTGCESSSTAPAGTTARGDSTPPSTTSATSSGTTIPAPTALGRSSMHPDITHGSRASGSVALTFHGAGDPALVGRLLEITRAHDSLVTVLAVGVWAAANPTVLPRLLEAGHEVGNHTWSHQTMPRLGPGRTATEIDRCAGELRRQIGTIGAWFRPSGTPRSTDTIRAAAHRAGYSACLAYDVDSLDYTDPGPAAIVRTVDKLTRPGSIVSLHLGHAETMAALPTLLTHLHRRHLRAVTVSELLAAR